MARFVLGLAALATSLAAEQGCTPELLRADTEGNYFRLVEDEKKTTCAELSDGKCPLAAPAPGFPCLVSCVASEAACAASNPNTPGVNHWEDPHLCTSCEITACKFCTFPKKNGPAQCDTCFDGFELIEYPDGSQECVVLGQGIVVLVAYVLFGIIVAVIMLVLLGTCYVAILESMGSKKQSEIRPSMTMGTTVSNMTSLLSGTTDELDLEQEEFDPRKAKTHNQKAISHGFVTSLQASIKFNSLRNATNKGRVGRMIQATLDAQHDDLGIGLQLFYNTQIFLIMFSLMGLGIAYLFLHVLTPGESLGQLLREASVCPTSAEKMRDLENRILQREMDRAKIGQLMGVVFWFLSVLLSWSFHYYQKTFQRNYDSQHQTADDYTLMLEGLPPDVTSEFQLHNHLEKELQMEGAIYGVCILYDLVHLPEEAMERLEEMLEHIIEWDDMKNGWVHSDFSVSLKDLEKDMEKDREEFKEMLQKHLRCCGRAYVVFHTEIGMIRALRERRGIRKEALAPRYKGGPEAEIQMVEVYNRGDQPDGIRYEKAEMNPEEVKKTLMSLPARQFVYILIYVAAAQLFYYFMQRPWHDCNMEASSEAAGVALASKGVLLVNFAIQTAVAFDVEGSDFIRIAKVDQVTFMWNTVLMAITLMYIVYQECDKAGMRSLFRPPEEEFSASWWEWRRSLVYSAMAEVSAYEALLSVFTEQTIMLYVLGEVGNVIGPVAFFWFALRAVFINNIGGGPTSRIQRFLRMVLPKTRYLLVLTPREAEKAQMLVPLLLWMEYTYVIIFPAIALTAVYFLDYSMKVWIALLAFSVLFFLWQRYVMLWLYGKSQFDSDETYTTFIVFWGVVLSKCAASFAIWAYRLQEITEWPFALLIFVLIFFLTFCLYVAGILYIEWLFGKEGKMLDAMEEAGGDPGYQSIVEKKGISWWNVNPVYVLKHRLCPDEPGFQVHDPSVLCWPSWSDDGFFEKGKEFRHRKADKLLGKQPVD